MPKWLIKTFQYLLILFVAVFLVLGAYRLISGRSLGLRSWMEFRLFAAKNIFTAIQDQNTVTSLNSGDFSNVIFVHHSVGENIISEGNLRGLLAEKGLKLTDQDYMYNGLTGPDGIKNPYTILIPDDNTDPDGLARIFNQPVFPLPVNALSSILQYEVIVIKSCFPASAIVSDTQFEAYRSYYLQIRDTADEYPDRLFIILPPPPLHPAETSPEDAARARSISDWLANPEFVDGHPNVAVFNLFDVFSGNDPTQPDFNMLKLAYQEGIDSHPNPYANEIAAPLLADFIQQATDNYRAVYAN